MVLLDTEQPWALKPFRQLFVNNRELLMRKIRLVRQDGVGDMENKDD